MTTPAGAVLAGASRDELRAGLRSLGFDDVPTIAEAGVPGYEAITWNGIIGPAGMPKAVVGFINLLLRCPVRQTPR